MKKFAIVFRTLPRSFTVIRIVDEKARQHIGIYCVHFFLRNNEAGSKSARLRALPVEGPVTMPAQAAMLDALTGRETTSRTPSGSSMISICVPAIKPSRRRMSAGSTTCPLDETVIVAILPSLNLLICTYYSITAYQVRYRLNMQSQIPFLFALFTMLQHPLR